MITKAREKKLHALEKEIGFEFKNLEFLNQALTHSSHVYELNKEGGISNERLEFLGDAVLSLIVSEHIHNQYPEYTEGALAKMRAAVVSRPVLAKHSRIINLGNYLLLGKGEEATGGRERESILADTFEAAIGAMYLDQGLRKVGRFVLDQLREEIILVEKNRHIRDTKTLLQEFTQDEFKTLPKYEVVKVSGPDHKQVFRVAVSIKGKVYGNGKGGSKKEAEQSAAKEALKRLKKIDKEDRNGF